MIPWLLERIEDVTPEMIFMKYIEYAFYLRDVRDANNVFALLTGVLSNDTLDQIEEDIPIMEQID
jgi:hypothetical protein